MEKLFLAERKDVNSLKTIQCKDELNYSIQ